MSVIELLKKRYAVKLFTGERIKIDDLKKMKEAIRLTPSSFNLQPWKVKIISDKKTLKQLQKASYDQPQISTASHVFVFCSLDSLKENKDKLIDITKKEWGEEKSKMFSEIIENAVLGMKGNGQKLLSEKEVYLALENLTLIATDLGYGACPIGGFDKKEYQKILSIPKGLNPDIVCAVGIPNDSPRKKLRFKDKDIFF